MKKTILIATLLVGMMACKKDPKDPEPEPTPAPTTGSLKVEFEPMVGDSELVFNTKWYNNANNDSFTVSIFRYYITNIVLTKSDNSTYAVPNSYFKIDHGITAVSYTHLDVYKRQIQTRITLSCISFKLERSTGSCSIYWV